MASHRTQPRVPLPRATPTPGFHHTSAASYVYEDPDALWVHHHKAAHGRGRPDGLGIRVPNGYQTVTPRRASTAPVHAFPPTPDES